MKYFIPDWEDRLDPDFDFINDEYSAGHKANPYQHDVYAHHIFERPPYDGVLFSLSIFQSKISLTNDGDGYQIRGKRNIHSYLKLPSASSVLTVMGDCGAFGYVSEEVPPPFYDVQNVANLYEGLGFDYGVSVDHIVVNYIFVRDKKTDSKVKKELTSAQKKQRLRITLDNAQQFYDYRREQNFSFRPIGSAQGYDLKTYVKSVDNLVSMGYDYIGVGGLVQYRSPFILEILEAIQPVIKGKRIHLFGVLRPDYLERFQRLGVASIDSASFLRKAWLRAGKNYLAPDGNWYTAIRVPQSSNRRVIDNAIRNGYSEQQLKKLEQESLKLLIEYDAGIASLDDTLNTVLEYDQLLLRSGNDGKNLRQKYERTLLDSPWKSCQCEICKKLGIQVIIFRGSNRNKRRGFHNTWVFYQRLHEINTKR